MMKKTIMATAIVAAMSAAHADEDFEFVESNVNIEHGPLAYTFRTYFKDDYDHHQIKYNLGSGLTVGFRYAEDRLSGVGAINGDPSYDLSGIDVGDSKQWEYRTFIEYTGLKWNLTDRWTFTARPMLEYRMFDVENDVVVDREDYVRFRAGAWTEYKLTEKVTPWASVDFYNNVSEMEFEQSRYQVGVNYSFTKHISAGPYVETRLTDDWEPNYTMLATQVSIKF